MQKTSLALHMHGNRLVVHNMAKLVKSKVKMVKDSVWKSHVGFREWFDFVCLFCRPSAAGMGIIHTTTWLVALLVCEALLPTQHITLSRVCGQFRQCVCFVKQAQWKFPVWFIYIRSSMSHQFYEGLILWGKQRPHVLKEKNRFSISEKKIKCLRQYLTNQYLLSLYYYGIFLDLHGYSKLFLCATHTTL